MPDTIEPAAPAAEEPKPVTAPIVPAVQNIDINSPITPVAKPQEIPEGDDDDGGEPPANVDPAKKKEEDDELARQSFADMLEGIEDPPPAAAPEDDEPAKPAAPPAEPAAKKPDEPPVVDPNKPAEPDPAQPKKKVRFELPDDLSDPVAPPVTPTVTPKPAAPPARPPEDPDAAFIATLPEEAQEELASAEIAERVLGDKYPGQRKKLLTWYKATADEVNRLKKENPDRSFSADDKEYQDRVAELQKQKPAVSRQDSREIERRVIRSEVKNDLLQELNPRISESERRNKANEIRPRISEAAEKFGSHIEKLVSTDSDVMKPIMEDVVKLGDKARDAYGLELDIIKEHTDHAKALMSEYLMVKNGASSVADALTPVQSELNDFIVRQGEGFLKTGGKRLVDSQGRRFIPNAMMNSLVRNVNNGTADRAELQKYWTFNDTMILEMLALKAKAQIEAGVKYEMERAKKYNFERKPKAAAEPPPAEPAKPLSAPKAKPRPSIGNGQRSEQPAQGGAEQLATIAADLGI